MIEKPLHIIGRRLYGTGIGRNRIVNNIVEHFLRNKQVQITVDRDLKMIIEPSRGFVEKTLFFGNGVMEPRETQVFKEHLKSNSVVVDVGAHIGYYTLLAAKHAKKVYSFEPVPENMQKLKQNIALNGFKNVTIEEIGLSNRRGNVEISFGNKNRIVPTISLDEYFQDKTVSIIKIDVDGAELDVLQGAKHVLKKNREIKVICELNIPELRSRGGDLEKALKYLEGTDFRFYSLNEKDFIKGCPKETCIKDILSWKENYFYSLFLSRDDIESSEQS